MKEPLRNFYNGQVVFYPLNCGNIIKGTYVGPDMNDRCGEAHIIKLEEIVVTVDSTATLSMLAPEHSVVDKYIYETCEEAMQWSKRL